MVELPKKQYEDTAEVGPYTVAARYLKNVPNDNENNSTIVDYKGQWIELFGLTQKENQPLPDGYTMLATIIKKHINHKLRSIVVKISEPEK